MKKILALIFAAVFALGAIPVSFAAENLTLNTQVNYDMETLTVSGETPARYGQLVSVVVYKPQTPVGSLAEIADRENPESVLPLENVAQIICMDNVSADYSGKFGPIEFSMANQQQGFYIVSVAGNGYQSEDSKASSVIYFETQDYINSNTIPAINAADESGIEALIREKELLFGVRVDEDYEANKDTINSLFVSIREDDFGGRYTGMSQVQNTFKAISVLRELYAVETAQEAEAICETYAALFNISISGENYDGHETVIYTHFMNLIKNNPPKSLKQTYAAFMQSVGLAAINRKNAEEITGDIKTYGEVLGLSVEDYEKACADYGATEVNKAFVGRDFENGQQVVTAFNLRVENLKAQAGKNNSPSSSGSGGSGGGGSSNIKIDSGLSGTPTTKLPERRFSDVPETHWSYTAVQTLAEMGAVTGDDSGRFTPEAAVTREQFTKMLVLALGLYDADADGAFSDIADDRWSRPYIVSAAARGIVTGYANQTFSPAAEITRQDAAVMLNRASKVKNIKLTTLETSSFTDSDTISGYAAESVVTLSSAGVISGFADGSFGPLQTLTKAQAAKLLYELLLK